MIRRIASALLRLTAGANPLVTVNPCSVGGKRVTMPHGYRAVSR